MDNSIENTTNTNEVIKKPHGVLYMYLKIVFFYSPLATAVYAIWISVVFSRWEQFWKTAAQFYLYGVFIASTCFFGAVGVYRVYEFVQNKKGKAVLKPPSLFLWLIMLLVFLPLGNTLARVAFFSLYQKAITLEGIFDWVQFREALFTGAIVMSVVFILEEFRGARQEKKEVELKLVKTQNERMRSQLKALQSQINPHLLFNSLNTIASFIPTDPDAAEEMTVELANLLRAVLEASREAHHSLADELRLCRDYLQIEKRRFGERLTTNIQIADTVKTKEVTIPVLVLQPLVENAVKYAVAPRASGGQIEIAIRKQDQTIEISIEDDGPGPGQSTASPGAGTGIENTRKRLELEWNSAAGLEIDERKSGGTRAVVRLPWPQCRIDGTIESNVRA